MFKLGKMALEKQKAKDAELEIVDDQDEDGLDVLVQSSIENKNKGFKRVGPTTYAEKVNIEVKTKNFQAEKTVNPANITTRVNTKQKVQYCHFYSNFGKCMFEETTGNRCKFSHQKAPTCNYDGKCNRKKCMFSHVSQMTPPGQPSFPRQMSEQPFLPQSYHPPISPWQAPMTGWMPPTQF